MAKRVDHDGQVIKQIDKIEKNRLKTQHLKIVTTVDETLNKPD